MVSEGHRALLRQAQRGLQIELRDGQVPPGVRELLLGVGQLALVALELIETDVSAAMTLLGLFEARLDLFGLALPRRGDHLIQKDATIGLFGLERDLLLGTRGL
jgi:hypothetical protein